MAKRKRKRATRPKATKPADNGQQIKRLTEVESLRVEAAQLRLEMANKDLAAIISRVEGVQDGDGLMKLEDGTWALVREAKAEAKPAETPPA